MKKNSSDNNESHLKTNQDQANLTPETSKELGNTVPSTENQSPLNTAETPPEPTPQTVVPSSTKRLASKRLADLRAAIPAGVSAKKGTVRLEREFAAELNRLEHLIFRRTNLEARTTRMVQAIIAEADPIFEDLFLSYHCFHSDKPHLLKQKLDAAHEKLAELRTIETRGKVITKYTLTGKEMSKLWMYAEAFSIYFAAEYTPRNALKLLWLRGGVLIAENISKPSKA